MQRGKGAEAGAGFGSGASGTVFGARGTATLFSKLTAVFAALFFATSLLLAYMGTRSTAEPTTVLERAAQAAARARSDAPPRAGTGRAAAPAPAHSSRRRSTSSFGMFESNIADVAELVDALV